MWTSLFLCLWTEESTHASVLAERLETVMWDEVGWTDGTGLVVVRMPQSQPVCGVRHGWCGGFVWCGVGRAGHDRNLEIGGDAGRGGQTRLGHWMWDPS